MWSFIYVIIADFDFIDLILGILGIHGGVEHRQLE